MTETKHFLIVDDDEDDRQIFREAISELALDVQCSEAVDGEDALKILHTPSEQLPDYIFLDLNMPRMDGKTLLSVLKDDCVLKNIPIIILSTSSNPLDMEETLQLGASLFFTKPIKFKDLCNKIQSVVESTDRGGD